VLRRARHRACRAEGLHRARRGRGGGGAAADLVASASSYASAGSDGRAPAPLLLLRAVLGPGAAPTGLRTRCTTALCGELFAAPLFAGKHQAGRHHPDVLDPWRGGGPARGPWRRG
jgi:hypothetical protein